jgi:hypothetical protein
MLAEIKHRKSQITTSQPIPPCPCHKGNEDGNGKKRKRFLLYGMWLTGQVRIAVHKFMIAQPDQVSVRLAHPLKLFEGLTGKESHKPFDFETLPFTQ